MCFYQLFSRYCATIESFPSVRASTSIGRKLVAVPSNRRGLNGPRNPASQLAFRALELALFLSSNLPGAELSPASSPALTGKPKNTAQCRLLDYAVIGSKDASSSVCSDCDIAGNGVKRSVKGRMSRSVEDVVPRRQNSPHPRTGICPLALGKWEVAHCSIWTWANGGTACSTSLLALGAM